MIPWAKALAGAKAAGRAVRAIPLPVWGAIVMAVAFWGHGRSQFEAGKREAQAACAEAQRKREDAAQRAIQRRDTRAATINTETAARGAQASARHREETVKSVERVRYVTRTIHVPAACDGPMPDGLRDAMGEAVRRANTAGRGV